MPTHCRQNRAYKTLKLIYNAYCEYGFDVSCICIDSSPHSSLEISSLPFVKYLSVPNCELQHKYVHAKYYLSTLENPFNSMVLWTPDDDLFLPNKDVVDFLDCIQISSSKFIIPFKYYFFSVKPELSGCLVIQEKWMHHHHISTLSLPAIDRLNSFVGYGVNSCWGLFSCSLFFDLCELTGEMIHVIDKVHYILLEDIWNIFLLSCDWINLATSPVCFRGNDRFFSQSSSWKSSYVAWSEIDSIFARKDIAKILLKYLIKNLPQLNSLENSSALNYAIGLVSTHVKGYIQAFSRMFGSGINLCLTPADATNNLEIPSIIVLKNRKDDIYIVLPKNLEKVRNWLYPPSHPLSSKYLCQSIDKYVDFLWDDRC